MGEGRAGKDGKPKRSSPSSDTAAMHGDDDYGDRVREWMAHSMLVRRRLA